ncbi:MAG: MATE family efflux transporter [Firmicutes bacterium]|nr:MATE family efflux transporter [Bacillota bacterium]
MAERSDFSQGSVRSNIMRLAIPMTLAQLIHLLYNIIDRMFIGHLPEDATLALTGLGLTFPIITMITAFSNLFSHGGAPLFSIARGQGNRDKAEALQTTSFTTLLAIGIILTVVFFIIKKPVLYLFGASDRSFPFADQYLSIYLLGSPMVMISLGMNSFINAQGFGRLGMMTVAIGAILNIILDPIFIYVFHMGVRGAALATVISQTVSALWVVHTMTSPRMVIPLSLKKLGINWKLLGEILPLGLSGFVMAVTNSLVQIFCNSTLQQFGGDMYIGIMTVIASIREVAQMPVSGITSAAQPVIGYNYGAKSYSRVKEGIKFMTSVGIGYMTAIWVLMLVFPRFFISLFNNDPELVEKGVQSMTIYFFGFFMQSLQQTGQAVFVALGRSKNAIFFSIFRKVIIVVPLTLLLPHIAGLGVNGVFLAEPISNWLGGLACFTTMMLTVWRRLPADGAEMPLHKRKGAIR